MIASSPPEVGGLGRHAVTLCVVVLASLPACDGDGCNGGPEGSASKYCQEQIARTRGSDAAMPEAEICKQCCIQEVPYTGRIEDGVCVCRR